MFHFSKLENIFFGYWIQNTRFLGCIVLIKSFKKYVVVKSLVETGNNIAMSCLSVSPMHCSVQIQSLHSPFQIYWVKVSQSVVSVYKQQKQHIELMMINKLHGGRVLWWLSVSLWQICITFFD